MREVHRRQGIDGLGVSGQIVEEREVQADGALVITEPFDRHARRLAAHGETYVGRKGQRVSGDQNVHLTRSITASGVQLGEALDGPASVRLSVFGALAGG